MKKIVIFIFMLGLLVLYVMQSAKISNLETPPYQVLHKEHDIEIRTYPRMLIAETIVSGDMGEARKNGFKILAAYIFGDNKTASGQANIKIPMTTPVMQQQLESGQWAIRFYMPGSYTVENIPSPINQSVKLSLLTEGKYVVIQFKGGTSKDGLKQPSHKLMKYITEKKLKTISSPILSIYNPPWTPSFMRRNELWIKIKD
jgi:effector-binding domain-containing protein